jgi:hypothetical protein
MRSTRLPGNRHQASATPLCAVVRRLCTHPQASRETLPAATPATAVCPRRSCRTTPVRPGPEPRAFVPPFFIWVHLLLVAGYRLRRSLQTSRAQVGRAPQRRHECAGVSQRPCSTGLSPRQPGLHNRRHQRPRQDARHSNCHCRCRECSGTAHWREPLCRCGRATRTRRGRHRPGQGDLWPSARRLLARWSTSGSGEPPSLYLMATVLAEDWRV